MTWSACLTASDSILGFVKIAETMPLPMPKEPSGSSGHWRTLRPGGKGKDQAGNAVEGKTWVRKSRLKKWFKPYKHQKEFIDEALTLPPEKGLIAAHGTGTGKTISSIAAFENLKEKKGLKRALIIAPAGLRTNYLESGVQKFTDSKGIITSSPNLQLDEDVEYVVTSYSAFRRNPDAFIENYKPDLMIVDEAQKLHNTSSSSYKAVKKAREKVPYFMALSASPIQNDPSDIAPLLSIAQPEKYDEEGKLVQKKHPLSSRTEVKKYVKKVPSKKRGPFGGKRKKKILVGKESLQQKVGPNVHYLEDLDADKKPIKSAADVPVPMSKEQQYYYDLSMKGVDPKIKAKIAAGEEITDREIKKVLVRLQMARRVSNSLHKHVPGISLAEAAERTPKIKKILDDAQQHLRETPDGKVIMYTNFVEGGVDVLEAGLDARNIKYGLFVGKSRKGVTEESRQQAVRDYKAGKNKVIIITSAGAEGLSLGNTTMVQMVDPHYNPEKMAQAEARGIRAKGLAHRPKERRVVQVKRYVTTIPKGFWKTITFQDAPRSIEQFVYETARSKDIINKGMRSVLKGSSDARQRKKIEDKKKKESLMYRYFGI